VKSPVCAHNLEFERSGSGVHDLKLEIYHSSVRNLKSEIPDLKFEISDLEFEISDLKFVSQSLCSASPINHSAPSLYQSPCSIPLSITVLLPVSITMLRPLYQLYARSLPRLPIAVFRPIQSDPVTLGKNIKNVLAAPTPRIGIILHGAHSPIG